MKYIVFRVKLISSQGLRNNFSDIESWNPIKTVCLQRQNYLIYLSIENFSDIFFSLSLNNSDPSSRGQKWILTTRGSTKKEGRRKGRKLYCV